MESSTKLLLALLVLTPAMIGISLYDSMGATTEIQTEQASIGAGHFTVTVRDAMGVVQAERQADNLIVNSGENCIAKMIFLDSVDAGTTVCAGTTDEGWDFFCLDENAALSYSDDDLVDRADETGLAACRSATPTWNQNSTGTSDALSKVTLRLSTVFTNSGAGAETIVKVGVFNSSAVSTNSMLSAANFTGVSVPIAGTLTVNYDYEVGGGTVP